jgi:hypothetical protein
MFFPGSRYSNAGTYTVTLSSGAVVTVTRLPQPRSAPLLGYHRRLSGQRLDLIANRYVGDPRGSWQLCDANGSVVPDALASHTLIAIPGKGS